jgi:hypothetical protein
LIHTKNKTFLIKKNEMKTGQKSPKILLHTKGDALHLWCGKTKVDTSGVAKPKLTPLVKQNL